MKNKTLKPLLLLLIIATTIAVVNASVFTYYPITLNVSPVTPPIVFSSGTNTSQPDLRGNKIYVNIGPNNASLTITVHPTYQTTYYKNITIIKNLDTKAYYIAIRVTTPLSGPTLAQMLIYDNANKLVFTVDLLTTGTYPANPVLLSAGAWYRIDLKFTYPEGSELTSSTAQVQLIYSPSSETPP